ncbi:hypothetical protein LCGC14_0849410 [marine sediment metagenome]|uniref:Uncharacterized protein n=1 Tax=marine sediment metagenome TaxID=412755 RepID=A0A0F9PAS8_9ZZZZ
MTTHQFHSPPGIGETIDNEEPSRLKSFVTDPKNLATMLVLASAMAQPRRSGRSALAHTLRGGVGALAFRGGLDKAMHEQSQADAEQASVAEARAREADTEAAAVAATEQRTGVVAETAEAGRESAEELQAKRLEAGQFAKSPPAGGTFAEKAVLQAQKDFSDAMLNWVGVGRQGEPPEYGTFLLRAMQGAALLGGVQGQVDFAATPEPTAEGELTIPGPVPTPEPRQPSPREASKEGRSSVAQHFVGKGIVDDALEAKLLRHRMPDFREIKEDTGVIAAARQMDELVKQQVSAMTIEEARAAIKERRWALSDETIAALRARIAELKPKKAPTAPLTEALGGLARRP